jgi:hypothetical protein
MEALRLLHPLHTDELARPGMGLVILGGPRPRRNLQIQKIYLRAISAHHMSSHRIHNANLGRPAHRRRYPSPRPQNRPPNSTNGE